MGRPQESKRGVPDCELHAAVQEKKHRAYIERQGEHIELTGVSLYALFASHHSTQDFVVVCTGKRTKHKSV